MGSDELPLRALARAALALSAGGLVISACLPGPATLCRDGTSECDGHCVELARDPEHCGACGVICGDAAICDGGSCQPPCGALTGCAGGCVDLTSDARHCGSCGASCGAGAICTDGACAPGCGGDAIACEGGCVDGASDEANCGDCGVACQGGERCADGVCACPDVLADDANCGACGRSCIATTRCVEGSCQPLCSGRPCAAGETVWALRVGEDGAADPASRVDQSATALALDAAGHAHVAIEVRGTVHLGSSILDTGGGLDVLVFELDPAGSVVSSFELSASGAERPRSLAVLPGGDLVLVGNYDSFAAMDGILCDLPPSAEDDGFVARLAPEGSCIWTARISSVANDDLLAVATTADSIVVAGQIAGPAVIEPPLGEAVPLAYAGAVDAVVARFGLDGALLESFVLGGQDVVRVASVAVSASDAIVVTGAYRGAPELGIELLPASAAGQEGLFVARLEAGAVAWARGFAITSPSSAHGARGVAVAVADESAVVLGDFRGALAMEGPAHVSHLGTRDALLFEIDPDGALAWHLPLGSHGNEVAGDLVIDEAGQVVITGGFEGQIDFGVGAHEALDDDDVFVAAFDRSPAALWSRTFAGVALDRGHALASHQGLLVVAGDFRRSLDLGHGPFHSPTGLGMNDNVVERFDAFVVALAR